MSSWAASVRSGSRLRLFALLLVAVLAVAVGLVVLGRWERQRWIDGEARKIERIRRLVGPLDGPTLAGFRRVPEFDCLVYRRGGNPFALELCIDRAGRVVEAIDRRLANRHYYSLRAEPQASPVHVRRAVVERLLRKMGAI